MNQNATKVLNYLADLPNRPDTRVISGQHGHGSSFSREYDHLFESVYRDTGKHFAMASMDFGWVDAHHENWPSQLPKLVDYWNDGGLVEINWNMNVDPFRGGTSYLPDLLNPSTSAHLNWMPQVRQKASWLQDLRDAGVVVQWRPFLEMNGSTRSAWWKGHPYQHLIDVWRFMHDLYSYDYGLDNLLWVYGLQATSGSDDKLGYYPGADYTNIVGMSVYVAGTPIDELDQHGWQELVALGHPIGFSETGGWSSNDRPPDPTQFDCQIVIDGIQAHAPEACFFNFWADDRAVAANRNAQGLVDHPWTITRAEVDYDVEPPPGPFGPDWKYLELIELERALFLEGAASSSRLIAAEYHHAWSGESPTVV